MDQRREIDLEVTRNLVQTALLAIWERDYIRAEAILDGLSACDKDVIQITYVYTLLYQARGQMNEAIDLLRSTARAQPGNDMAKALLGFVLQQDGRGGWRELLRQVVANAADAPAVELAEHLLQTNASSAAPPPSKAVESFPFDMVRA